MLRSSKVKSYFYKSSGKPNGELVYYVVGFKSKVSHFKVVLSRLRKLGYDVLAFEYDPAVLAIGDPQLLIDVVNDIIIEVNHHTKNYQQTISMGVSLGAFIAFDVQKEVPNALVGAYATACVGIANSIFNSSYLSNIREAFISNGFDKLKLERAWRELEAAPTSVTFPTSKSFIAFDGTFDKLVSYKEAKQNAKAWARKGIRVRLYTVRGLGHMLTIIRFMLRTKQVIALAKSHHTATSG